MTPNKNNKPGFIPPHGGYEKLHSFRKAEIIYDGTVYFTHRFFDRYDRTVGQMVQAARSGKQNIAKEAWPQPQAKKRRSNSPM